MTIIKDEGTSHIETHRVDAIHAGNDEIISAQVSLVRPGKFLAATCIIIGRSAAVKVGVPFIQNQSNAEIGLGSTLISFRVISESVNATAGTVTYLFTIFLHE